MALEKEEMNFKQMTDNIDESLPIVIDKANPFSFNSYANRLPRIYEDLQSC